MSYQLTYSQGGLSAAADYIRSKGRNEDTQLVHMTPGEVQALQKMAENHGGSLTINPHTGLPEAGFLGDILSVAAPFALNAIFPGAGAAVGSFVTGGAATGALATGLGMGLISGGISALTTGDLGQGLKTGLTSGLLSGAMSSFNPTAASAPGAGTAVAKTAVPAVEAAKAAQVAATTAPAVDTAVNTGLNVAGTYSPALSSAAVPAAAAAPSVAPGMFDKISTAWKGLTPMQQLGVGGAGLLGAAALTEKQPGLNVPTDKGTIRPYTYSANRVTPTPIPNANANASAPMYDAAGYPILDKQEQRYYNPSYTELPTYKAANGGLMAAPFGNDGDMYPQSQQEHTNFATPTQMPTSAEVVGSDYDAMTSPYTGQEMPRMADGGIARDSSPTGTMSFFNGVAPRITTPDPVIEQTKYSYDPKSQRYSEVLPPAPVNNNAPRGLFETFLPGMFRTFGGNPIIPENYGAFSPLVESLNKQQAQPANGGMGNPFMSMFKGLEQQIPKEQKYSFDPQTQQYVALAEGGDTGYAQGGLLNLGSYSDGGHLLKGPGDGVSDDIPAVIGGHQPARLADGEFVVPARIVSELGNGSTDAGAKRLYAMMDRIQSGRKKTVGKSKVAVDSKAEKHLPA